MADSSGTSTFSFSTTTTSSSFMTSSFTDLLVSDVLPAAAGNSRGLSDRIAERTGSGGVPKFKSLPPPSLPLSPLSLSPSSYFAFPPGLSPSVLLDSPVLLSHSNTLPSPTTGTFPAQDFDWKQSLSRTTAHQKDVKQDGNKGFPDFSFQPINPFYMNQNDQERNDRDGVSRVEFSHVQMNSQSSRQPPPPQAASAAKEEDDGYNWRKYGQKQVKGSENPRSYYKCTYPNCVTKKKVERGLDGQITEIVYRGSHDHPRPPRSTAARRPSSSSTASSASALPPPPGNDVLEQQSYWSNSQIDSVATPENSSISFGDDEYEQSSKKRDSGGEEVEEDEPLAKRWRAETESEGICGAVSRTVREPRVVVQTTSDIDILDDGYRWRKYGQKVVKGNPNPRSYYKCTSAGCGVRKHVERASQDIRSVITTYEGKHNHDVPTARGSGTQSLNRGGGGGTASYSNSGAMTIRPSPVPHHSIYPVPNGRGNFGYPQNNYSNQLHEMMYTKAKEEPRDDLFMETLLA
ncbi:unnamed protein product [Cuscuta campestris]|uniref:WRKY domain-containing protein n=1 Tax=Cuscuta campestris TaxID=132261 RepID=A0A484NI91_9ASTE|nr:unnamed protein product [Cuscuta campestris]